MHSYSPGLHILATFRAPVARLTDAAACQAFFDQQISHWGLVKVGEVYHSFPNASFTAVVGLTESHLSIHTWPEFGQATFDVFLSNYQRDNSATVRQLYAETLRFFEGEELTKTEVAR
ncbi:S-adenosylmethionine decarboxylase family protein [Hymenobacter cellulosilyticus]|uniref:S-adenosylmethionine decarboxylase n=1 Tax=Hymenobacter cellulosilyticus TaxID=2932248 RepID=A0A8T9QEX7_9BACT|nr:S-adenosylmethionine decarboxylase [Hymenobacter cellulosilyticus]UOQ74718.1 S-adenosylmethionine decarboxylase [Hymenobacter cellulosilyticus]